MTDEIIMIVKYIFWLLEESSLRFDCNRLKLK